MARFVSIGGLATLIHVAVALLGREAFGLFEITANGLGWLTAVAISYFGHLRFTFGVNPNHALQLPRFFVISVGGLIVSSATVALVTAAGGNFILAMAIVAGLVPIASYLLMQMWVFVEDGSVTIVSLETVLAAAATLVLMVTFWGQPMNHDTVWYHVATRKWLAGAELYVDIYEVNPPLSFYFTIPVVTLADLTGLGDKVAQLILTAALTFTSLFLTGRALVKTGLFTPRQRATIITGTGTILIALTLRDFAQREHIFILLFLPWITSTINVRQEPSAAFTLLAAIGMCLKPFFAIFPLITLTLMAAQKRSLAPLFSRTALIFLFTGLAYIAAVSFWHPVYFTEIVPTASIVYGAYGTHLATAVIKVAPSLAALVFAGVWVTSRKSPATGTITFFAAALAGTLSYLIQGTGFGYHAIPFLVFGCIGCLLAFYDTRCWKFALLGLGTTLSVSISKGYYDNHARDFLVQVIKEHTEVESLLVLTTHVYASAIVAVDADVDWASEYPAQWLIPGALSARARTNCAVELQRCADIKAILDRNRNDLLRDILTGRADMIVFDHRAGYFDGPFEWEAFLAEDRPFTEIMARYRPVGDDNRFSYWKRTDLD